MNPFDLRGPEFLFFYVAFSVLVILALYLSRGLFENADIGRVDLADPYLIAYLRGGPHEALRVATISLIDRRLLVPTGTKIEVAKQIDPNLFRRPIERALMEKFASPTDASAIFSDSKLKSACDLFEVKLKKEGLIPDDAIVWSRRVRVMIALFLVEGVGALKILIGLSRGRTNIGFLVILMVVVGVIVLKSLSQRLTPKGAAVLKDSQTLYSDLKRRAARIQAGGATLEVAMLAALFGVGALAGDGFAYTKTLFPRSTQSSGSSSCGSSCGSSCSSSCGGGGCGGGCGGCGS